MVLGDGALTLTRAERLQHAIHEGYTGGVFPGAVIYYQSGTHEFSSVIGNAEITPEARPMQWDTMFDIASLTKVVATVPAVLRSIQMGKFEIGDKIAGFFPEWNDENVGFARQPVTVLHLLTHTSGLPGWRPLYLRCKGPETYLDAICHEPLEYEPGSRVVYSDLGFMLLGFILERVWGKSLNVVCKEIVFEGLNMAHTDYNPAAGRGSFAATEHGNRCEYGMAHTYAKRVAEGELSSRAFAVTSKDVERFLWRQEVTCGQVNDGNAYYGLQGMSGHAGLFSTVEDLQHYARAWLDNRDCHGQIFIRDDLYRLATVNQTLSRNIARTAGFEAVPETSESASQPCSAGQDAPVHAFGHTGFTGTSLWVDPASQSFVIALTNRTHPQVKEGIVEWRRVFHTAAFAEL